MKESGFPGRREGHAQGHREGRVQSHGEGIAEGRSESNTVVLRHRAGYGFFTSPEPSGRGMRADGDRCANESGMPGIQRGWAAGGICGIRSRRSFQTPGGGKPVVSGTFAGLPQVRACVALPVELWSDMRTSPLRGQGCR